MCKLERLLKGPHPGKTIKSGAKSLKHQRAQTEGLHTTAVKLMETLSRVTLKSQNTEKIDSQSKKNKLQQEKKIFFENKGKYFPDETILSDFTTSWPSSKVS